MPSRKKKAWQQQQTANTIRKVRKEIKRNRKPMRVRHKDWTSYRFDDPDAFDDIDLPQDERVMPRGERERRRAILALAQKKPDNIEEETPAASAGGNQGIVVEVSSSRCRVDLGERSLVCQLRGSLSAEETGYTNVLAVGDKVLISENGSDQGVVEEVLPRRSVLARPDVHSEHLQQVFVANAEQLLIVTSWREPHIWLELIDRYLIAAERYHLQPILCVNKVDLAENIEACRRTLHPYLDLGYRVIFTSALSGEGVDRLRNALTHQTTVLAGLSGVGKSSLLSAVQPSLELRTAQVSRQSGEGRHTTTQVTLHRLEMGGFVADTPGIREFGVSGLKHSELATFFPEIAATSAGCRFGNCTHIHEPGCAVKSAVQQGQVSADRYHSYRKIYDSLPA